MSGSVLNSAASNAAPFAPCAPCAPCAILSQAGAQVQFIWGRRCSVSYCPRVDSMSMTARVAASYKAQPTERASWRQGDVTSCCLPRGSEEGAPAKKQEQQPPFPAAVKLLMAAGATLSLSLSAVASCPPAAIAVAAADAGSAGSSSPFLYGSRAAAAPLALTMPANQVQFDPVTAEEREESMVFERRVERAVMTLEEAREAQIAGLYPEALALYNEVVSNYMDLALAAYARVGRALMLYEVGDRRQAILEMEDMAIDIKGYPEIHAALAAAFYVDKRAPIAAEKQLNLALLMDKRYSDLEWVSQERNWPPSLVDSLERFLTLR